VLNYKQHATPETFDTIVSKGGRLGCVAIGHVRLLDFIEEHSTLTVPIDGPAPLKLEPILTEMEKMFPGNAHMSSFCETLRDKWQDFTVTYYPVGTKLRHNGYRWILGRTTNPKKYEITTDGLRPLDMTVEEDD